MTISSTTSTSATSTTTTTTTLTQLTTTKTTKAAAEVTTTTATTLSTTAAVIDALNSESNYIKTSSRQLFSKIDDRRRKNIREKKADLKNTDIVLCTNNKNAQTSNSTSFKGGKRILS